MLLRTRLRITTTASVGAILLLAAGLTWSVREANRGAEDVELARTLMKEQYERSLLRDEYLLSRGARARTQWEEKTADLPALLARAATRFDKGEERETVTEMFELLASTTALFREIVRRDDASVTEQYPRALAAELRVRSIATLRIAAHDLYSRARQLSVLAATRLHATQTRITLAMVAIFCMVFAITFVNSRSASITLERRITRLREGAEKVAGGDLEHRISVQGDDELAEFGGAFDRMTARLQGTYTTLEAEVVDRRRAQEEVGRLNDQLRQQVAALEVSNRELEAFSYAVSHDLRAPLRSVAGFSQAVLEDYGPKLDATGRQYLELASEAARDMGQLIDDLLRLSRVSRDDMVRQPVDLSELARLVIDDLRSAEPDRRVDVELAPGLTAEGDPTLLRLAIDNLLRNAWKFTSRHPTARITLGRTSARGQEVFFVADDGAGFDMAYVDKLFNPFQRLHRASEFPGTGIGLATVRRIVRRHGGEAWAHGEVEKGATICFTLPSREGSHAEQDHPAGRGQPQGRAPDRAGLQAVQDSQPAPRGA